MGHRELESFLDAEPPSIPITADRHKFMANLLVCPQNCPIKLKNKDIRTWQKSSKVSSCTHQSVSSRDREYP
jgi:hypothetical protein